MFATNVTKDCDGCRCNNPSLSEAVVICSGRAIEDQEIQAGATSIAATLAAAVLE
jgi:hypothetical protein